MRAEFYLFLGVALFFGAETAFYLPYGNDPAGASALLIACLMASVIAFFLYVQGRSKGKRPEDRRDGEIHDRAGPLDFFPPRSIWPVVTAFGFAVTASGVPLEVWISLVGLGITGLGVGGFALQFQWDDEAGAE
jgi:cytochrome c oxidase subunit IV